MVVIAFKGRQSVEADVAVKNREGKVLRTARQTVERNRWEIVPFDRLREASKASVLKAIQRQESPAELKVLDRSARPGALPLDLKRQPGRGRERTI